MSGVGAVKRTLTATFGVGLAVVVGRLVLIGLCAVLLMACARRRGRSRPLSADRSAQPRRLRVPSYDP